LKLDKIQIAFWTGWFAKGYSDDNKVADYLLVMVWRKFL